MLQWVLVYLALFVVDARNPGASITLDETAIVKVKDFFLPKLIADIRKLTIPGEKGHDYSFDDIKIKSVGVKSVAITLHSPNEIRAQADGLEIAIDSTGFEIWKHVIGIKIHCHGHFSASISGTNIGITIPFEDHDGKPYVPSVATDVDFGSVKIDHHMDHLGCKILDKIASLFVNINKKLEDLVKKEVPGLIQKEVKEAANKAFAGLAVTLPIGKHAQLDYALVAEPKVSPVALSLLSLAEFQDKVHPHNSTMNPAPLPTPPRRDAVVELSPFVIDTASEVFTSQGLLHKTNMSIGETTTLLKAIIPKAYDACPGCPLTASFDIYDAPRATFKPNDASLQASDVILTINAVHTNGSLDELFTLSVNTTVGLFAGVKNLDGTVLITIQFNLTSFIASEKNSTVGPLPIAPLNAFISIVVGKHIIPYINSFLKGIPLPPIPDVELTNTVLSVAQNALVVASDISLKKPLTIDPDTDTLSGITWITATHAQPVPDHAVVGGHWGAGTKLNDYYVCRGNETKKNEVDPGKAGYYKALWSCCWADHVTEHCEFVPKYQVLTSSAPLTWVQGSVGEPCPNGAVVGGHFPFHKKTENYYICRAHDAKRNQTVPGKLGYYDELWSCCWSNGGLEHCLYIPNYEVLVDQTLYETASQMRKNQVSLV